MPKQTIFLETPVILFSLLRMFDRIFDIIVDNPYFTQYKDSAIELIFDPEQIYCRGNLMQFYFQKFIFYQRQNILTSLPCFVDVVVIGKYSFELAEIKLRHYEKATKLEKIYHLVWQNSCFYSVVSKQVGFFFKFLCPSQKI